MSTIRKSCDTRKKLAIFIINVENNNNNTTTTKKKKNKKNTKEKKTFVLNLKIELFKRGKESRIERQKLQNNSNYWKLFPNLDVNLLLKLKMRTKGRKW